MLTISCILPSSSSDSVCYVGENLCLLILMCLITLVAALYLAIGRPMSSEFAKDMCQHCYENHWNQVIQDWTQVQMTGGKWHNFLIRHHHQPPSNKDEFGHIPSQILMMKKLLSSSTSAILKHPHASGSISKRKSLKVFWSQMRCLRLWACSIQGVLSNMLLSGSDACGHARRPRWCWTASSAWTFCPLCRWSGVMRKILKPLLEIIRRMSLRRNGKGMQGVLDKCWLAASKLGLWGYICAALISGRI